MGSKAPTPAPEGPKPSPPAAPPARKSKGPLFKLINKATGLAFGEHKTRHPLRYYGSGTRIHEDTGFQQRALKAILRADGAVGFQDHDAIYDDGELWFMPREDWTIQWVCEA